MNQMLLLVSVLIALFLMSTKEGKKVAKDVSKSVSSITSQRGKGGFPSGIVLLLVLVALLCLSRKGLVEGVADVTDIKLDSLSGKEVMANGKYVERQSNSQPKGKLPAEKTNQEDNNLKKKMGSGRAVAAAAGAKKEGAAPEGIHRAKAKSRTGDDRENKDSNIKSMRTDVAKLISVTQDLQDKLNMDIN